MNMQEHVAAIFIAWAQAQRAERGDAFATESEMAAIASDPTAWLNMIRGYDAFELMRDLL